MLSKGLRHQVSRCLASSSQHARATKAVPIKVISVSKGDSASVQALSKEWSDKISRYTPITHTNLRASEPAAAAKAEGERILKQLQPQDRMIVLDERGKALTSYNFSSLIAEAGDRNASSMVFCIGGPHGHSEAVRQRADCLVSLSPLVLNHQVALIVLLEQIYRGWTILRGEPYHHGS